MEKSSAAYRSTTMDQKHFPEALLTNVNQFAPTTIHYDILWPIREILCQKWQHSTTNSHRAKLEENPLMVDPVKSDTEVDLNNSNLLPLLQSTLCRRLASCPFSKAHNGITSVKTFPINKLGGFKCTSTFHKPPKMNQHQTLKLLDQNKCYAHGNWSLIVPWRRRSTFRNLGNISWSPASRKATQTKYRWRNTTPRRGARTSAVLFKKKEETYRMGQCRLINPDSTGAASPPVTWKQR